MLRRIVQELSLVGALLGAMVLLSAQSPIAGFPPGVFTSRAAIDGGSTGSPMTTPVLAMGLQSAPGTGAATYFPLITGLGNSASGTAFGREVPFPISGTFSNLQVSFPSGVGSGSYGVALTHNASIAGTLLYCQATTGTPSTCTDTSDSTSVAAGDTVGIIICPGPITAGVCVPGTAPTSNTNVQMSMTFTSTNNNEGFFSGSSGALNTGTTEFASLVGFTNTVAVSDAALSNLVPVGGVIDNLYATVSAAPGGAGKSWAFTLFQNGSTTGLTCTISNAATSCNLLGSGAITVAANDLISMQVAPTGTPAAAVSRWGVRWQPTTAGQSIQTVAGTTLQNAATGFSYVNGSVTSGGTRANNENIVVAGATGFTFAQPLSVAISTDPGNTKTRTFTLEAATVAKSLACTITGNGTTSLTCTDTNAGHNSAVTAGQLLDWAEGETGTPTAVTSFKIGVVTTVP